MQGSKRTIKERQLKVGWAESKVIAVCPTQVELMDIGIDVDEEPEYVKENKDKVDVARIDFWMEEVKTGYKYKRSFFLENAIAETKLKEDATEEEKKAFVKKTQYINQVGESQWVVEKKELSERMKHFRKKVGDDAYEILGDKRIRIAKRGEGDLMAFVRAWAAGFEMNNPETDILLDMKKIFAGNFRELKEQIDGEFTTIERNGKTYPITIADILEIKTVVGDDGPKDFQSVWRKFVPGWQMKNIRNTKFTRENILKWKKEGKGKDNPSGVRWLKDYESAAVDIMLGKYGSKNFYSLELMHDYNPDENFAASSQAVTESAETNDTDDSY